MKSKGVRTTHPEYDDMLEQWERCCDVERGQRAIHKAGKKYLPKNGAESDDEFKSRLARSDFFNAFYRTVSGLVGMAFSKDPTLALPTAIEPLADNIDLSGTPLYSLAKDICEDVLEYGRVGIMVDHPPLPDAVSPISVAIAEQLGLRPAIKTYDAKCIINWRYARVLNAKVLVRVVLKESADISTDEFEEKTEDRYRVLDLDDAGLYRQRVFRIDDKGNDELVDEVYPVMNGQPLNYLPFIIIGANGIALDVEEPPLIDLVDANVAHYQLNSDIRVAMHFGVPTFYITGYTKEEGEVITVGSRSAIILPDPASTVGFAEPDGAMLPAMQQALKEIEQRMAILGARMIADETRQAETLGATQIKRAGENSVMAAIVIAVSDSIRWALEIMAQWAGASGEVVFEISREFNPLGLSAQDMQAIFAGVQQGIISEREAFELLQRGDMIDGEKDFEEHQEELSQVELPRPAVNDSGVIAA